MAISLKSDWPLLGLFASIALLLVTMRQCAIQEGEAKKRPKLEYSASEINEVTSQAVLNSGIEKLTNEIFARVLERKKQFPSETYVKSLNKILPVEVPIPYSPSGVLVRIKNSGLSNATEIRITIDLGGKIGNVDWFTNEHAKIEKGGKGQNSVTVLLDRLPPEKYIDVKVHLQGTTEKSDALLVADRSFWTTGGDLLLPFPYLDNKFKPQPRVPLTAITTLTSRTLRSDDVGNFFDIKYHRPMLIAPPMVEVTSDEGINGILSEKLLELPETRLSEKSIKKDSE